ncbi:MAG: type IIL restriction-modification enzyme MmeI [Phormidesmis sp.]
MNAIEIEEAVSRLAEAPFEPEAFPFAFLEAFGNKPTTLKRLKSKCNSSNQSDFPDSVLQRNNIHLKVCLEGEVTATLTALRDSPATVRHKAKFILATDGKSFEAENLADGETVACDYPDFHDHFGFFLPEAGITTRMLLHHGSPIAAAIDTMGSAHRTNVIAEAAIRATGDKLYQAAARFSADDAERRPIEKAQMLFKQVLAGAIEPPSEDELAV